MGFPQHVLEVKRDLMASKDSRLSMMKKLMEQKDKDNYNEVGIYEKMWCALLKEEAKYGGDVDNNWVYSFIDSVIEADTLPEHAYISAIDRKDLLDNIKKYTSSLTQIYKTYGFDDPIITNDGQFFHGFTSHKVLDNNMGRFTEIEKAKVSVNDTLEYFAERAIEEINEYSHKGKKSEDIKAIRFIRLLAERNSARYNGATLNLVLKTAIFSVHGAEYQDSDISNILNRTKKKQTK